MGRGLQTEARRDRQPSLPVVSACASTIGVDVLKELELHAGVRAWRRGHGGDEADAVGRAGARARVPIDG
jgi:hypothetical protein